MAAGSFGGGEVAQRAPRGCMLAPIAGAYGRETENRAKRRRRIVVPVRCRQQPGEIAARADIGRVERHGPREGIFRPRRRAEPIQRGAEIVEPARMVGPRRCRLLETIAGRCVVAAILVQPAEPVQGKSVPRAERQIPPQQRRRRADLVLPVPHQGQQQQRPRRLIVLRDDPFEGRGGPVVGAVAVMADGVAQQVVGVRGDGGGHWGNSRAPSPIRGPRSLPRPWLKSG
jgi:hypothetical protein